MITRRRCVLGFVGGVCSAYLAYAGAQGRVPRIGLLANGSPQPSMPRPVEALRRALRELGYIEGQTLQIDYRWAEGRAERLPELAAGLVSSRVDLIVASGDGAIRAAMGATRTIPIVMATSGDAVGAGFVRSLAFPGANVTGMTAMVPELGAKRLQLLRSLRSDASRVAVLWSPADPVQALEWKEMRLAAPVLGVSLQGIEFRTVADVDAAIDDFDRRPPQLLVVFNAGATLARRQQLLERVAKVGSIAMYEASEWVAEGGLISYGVTHADLFSRSATFIDKILKGENPANLPVEQPTRFPLVINLKTARALGLAIPQSLLLRADEVIQ